ncbi:MAG TPA: STAS domain-containing protein [Candidatus Goldiibacteriota bacterium]|nr:STAS domain-containing protein [Candidatus Goldiibacteriota bacterium]
MAVMTSVRKVVVLILKGDIDIEDMLALKGIISTFIEKENLFFVLDFSAVTHINVSGIEYLNERKERARALGGDIKIVGSSDYIRNLFIYAGYWGEFEFYATEEDAVRAFDGLI